MRVPIPRDPASALRWVRVSRRPARRSVHGCPNAHRRALQRLHDAEGPSRAPKSVSTNSVSQCTGGIWVPLSMRHTRGSSRQTGSTHYTETTRTKKYDAERSVGGHNSNTQVIASSLEAFGARASEAKGAVALMEEKVIRTVLNQKGCERARSKWCKGPLPNE